MNEIAIITLMMTKTDNPDLYRMLRVRKTVLKDLAKIHVPDESLEYR